MTENDGEEESHDLENPDIFYPKSPGRDDGLNPFASPPKKKATFRGEFVDFVKEEGLQKAKLAQKNKNKN